MINSKQELSEWINVERNLWIKCNFPNGSHKKVKSRELLYLKALRHVEYYKTFPKKKRLWVGGVKYVYYRYLYNKLSKRNNVWIPPFCFGKGLMISHLQNIVVSEKARVGEYCRLFHNTTIGIKLGEQGTNSCPTIGNYVTIGVGASVLGGINVADRTTIGAGTVLLSNVVDENMVVAGIPGRDVKKNMKWSMYDFVLNATNK